jgi:hypothetical protein
MTGRLTTKLYEHMTALSGTRSCSVHLDFVLPLEAFQDSPDSRTDRISERPEVHLVRGLGVDDAVVWQLPCRGVWISPTVT